MRFCFELFLSASPCCPSCGNKQKQQHGHVRSGPYFLDNNVVIRVLVDLIREYRWGCISYAGFAVSGVRRDFCHMSNDILTVLKS